LSIPYARNKYDTILVSTRKNLGIYKGGLFGQVLIHFSRHTHTHYFSFAPTPAMANLIETLSGHFNCKSQRDVVELLNHPIYLQRACDFLKHKKLETTYADRSGEIKTLEFEDFSLLDATQQKAYNNYLRITVQQHFYCRHRIRLIYAGAKCVAAYSKQRRSLGHYPPELLRIKLDEGGEDGDNFYKDETLPTKPTTTTNTSPNYFSWGNLEAQ
jgi:hypothetical protein